MSATIITPSKCPECGADGTQRIREVQCCLGSWDPIQTWVCPDCHVEVQVSHIPVESN